MKHLKKIRQMLGLAMFCAFILMFIRFDSFGWLAELINFTQFAPLALGQFMWSAAGIIIGILLLTAIAGRVYCSVLCPLGLLQDAILRLKRVFRKPAFKTLPSRAGLHFGLAGLVIGCAFAGLMLPVSIFEPFALAGRFFAAIFQPAAAMLFKFKSSLAGDSVSWLGQASLKPFDGLNFAMVAVSLAFLLILCIKWGRIYCNTLCPVGALLRLVAGNSYLKIALAPEKCVSCGMCVNVCKAGCIDANAKTVDNSRCVACFNCLDTCKLSGITLQGLHNTGITGKTSISPGRRAFTGGLISAAAGYLIPTSVIAQPETATAILPPGAESQALFRSRCISCHLCVAACPSSVIRPASPAPGVLSIQQPSLNFDLGMCEQNCNLCSQICPVMAIRPVIAEHKKFLKIGEVVYKKHLCVVETNGTDCGACAEHCPTQAVRMVPYRNNLMIPETDPTICIGCGSCEHICPVRPEKAIVVKPVSRQTMIKLKEQELLPEKAGNDFPF